MSASLTSAPNPTAESSTTNLRVLTPRPSLPGSRAIVGGVLVAVAVLGTYAATTQTGKDDTRTVVVAAHDIAPGTRLQASDFRTVRVPLDASVANHVLQSTAKLTGATVLGPLRSGDIVQTSAIATSQSQSPYLEVSFSIPAARALDGNLQPGETVDVLTTDKSSATPPSARVAAANAHVLRTQSTGNGSIGHSGDITITVGVSNRSEAAAIAAAVDQGQITLVRTTGVTPNE